MDWESVLTVDTEEIERNESLSEGLYNFFLHNGIPQDPASPQGELVGRADSLMKLASVLRLVLRVKGLEAQAAEEELGDVQAQYEAATSNVGASERDLLDKVVQLEKEVRHRDTVINQLRQRAGAPSPAATNEARRLQELVTDLRHELSEVKRSLEHERRENERLSGDVSSERLRARELDRQMERYRHDIEDYRRQLDWQRESEASRKGDDSNYKRRLQEQDKEISEQLDQIEEMIRVRETLESQLHELTLQLGHVEEQRIGALRDMESMKLALVESDRKCDELETRNQLLEGQVNDLQDKVNVQRGADEHIMTLVSGKAQEWEALLSSKQSEVEKHQTQVVRLQEQLRVAQRQTDKATLLKLKKQLQEREEQVTALHEEMTDATQQITSLTNQLEEAKKRGDPAAVNAALKQELEQLEDQVESLGRDLQMEVQRREEAELQKEEKDVELAQALGRLGEYERGEYGLHEAVLEIKMKKDELAVRDKDIVELSQHVSQLENQLNQLSEENEALRDQLGLDVSQTVDASNFKNKRHAELCTLREQYRTMEKEVERLQEEKQALRKQLVAKALNKVCVVSGAEEGGDDVQELRSKVYELERLCESSQLERETERREMTRVRAELEERRQQVRHFESAVKELSKQQRQVDGGQTPPPASEAVERLVAMLEAQSAADGGKYDITLQLKSEVSQLSGQNRELREQLNKREGEMKAAIRELERKHYEVEELTKEVKLYRTSQAKFQPLPFPEGMTMTSSDVITSLNDHLLHVLKELQEKERELTETQEGLEKAQRKFSVIIHQQGVLYKEYSDAKKQWEREREELVSERNQLFALREQDQTKMEELKNLQEMLSTDEDEQKQRMADLSRKITVLRVNEKSLSRRYSLLHESETWLRKEAEGLRRDMVLLEKAVTERMGYLKRHKEASLFKIASLQHQLAESVPQNVLDKANQEYNELVLKYQECLHQQTSYTATTSNIEHLQAEVKTLRNHLERVKQELTTEKQKCRLLEEATPSSSSSAAGGHTHHGGVAERVATLEMKELNERQRAELAHTRCKQLQETVLQLEQRNSSLESKFSELSQKLLTAQVREGELRDQLASCLPEAEKSSLEAELMELRKCHTELSLENNHLKEVADVARQQVVFMETKQKSHDLELSSLRHQLLDLQMQSDPRAMTGKLHHQVVTLQVSEASALKKAEECRYKMMHLEAALMKCEQERDKLSETMYHVRCETQNKIKHLRDTVQALRRQYAGAVPLSDQEHHAHLLRKLREDKQEAEKVRESARKDQETAQMKLAELELQHSNLQELIGALREQSSSVSSAAGRLTEWHAKMGEMRLTELRLKRTNERLQDQLKHAEDLVSSSERSFVKLEQDLVQVTKDYESAQLSWEHREMELEQHVEQLQRQLAHTATATVGQERSDALDKQLPLNAQLEQALSHLQDKSRVIAEMRTASQRAEHHANRLEKALTKAQSDLLNREKEISELRMTISRLPSEEEDHSRLEVQRELRLAQERVGQLQLQVSQKEVLVEKYQHLLQAAREESSSAAEAHKREVSSLMRQLHSQTDSALSRLREAELEAVNIPQPVLPTEGQLDRLRELEELTVNQEREARRLKDEVKLVRQQLKQVQQESKKSLKQVEQDMEEMRQRQSEEVTSLQSELESRSSRVVELEQEVEVLEGELSAAQQAAKQAPSRTMKALVERLRNQLAVKEKQQRALSQALSQVRSDLVETARKTLEGETNREIQEANVKVLVEKRTKELQDQLQEVREDLESQLRESQRREAQSRGDVARLEEELTEKTAIVKRLEGEVQFKRRAMEQTKSREQRMNQELHELRSRLEQSSGVFELQNRVKILQGKLDKQKQLTKSYEETLKGQKQSTTAVGRSDGGATSAQIDSKHHSVDVMKWEESKKWQRRVDTLRAKLSEKNKELEGAHKQLTSFKEMLARSDREKGILQGKLKSTQKAINEATGHGVRMTTDERGEGAKMEAEERHELRTKIFELENEVQKLQHQLKVDNSTHLFEARLRCEQLAKSVKVLETQLQQQQQQPEGSHQLHAIREHERQLQDELLQSQRENLQLQLEYEQAMVDVPRLKARVEHQSEYIEVLKSEATTAGNLRSTPGSKEGGTNQRSVSELERVITAMRKVVERLQSENEALKKTRSGQNKSSSAAAGKMAAMEAENKQLKSELDKLRSAIPLGEKDHHLPPKSPYAKIVADNERLQKDLKKEVDKNEKLQLSLATLEVRNKKLQQELTEHSRPHPIRSHDQSHDTRYCEERLETLQAEVEKKTAMLMEVKRHLREAAEREQQLKSLSTDTQLSDRYLAVLKERDNLQQQVKQLKKELDAFDPNFFEELEDLKYNCQEAVRKNVEYEEQLNKLSQQYGFKLPSIT